MSSVGIKFVPLPEPLQKRLTNVMKKVESGEIDADWGGELFMHYFSQRLGIIANSSPHYEKLHKAAKGQRFALIIKGTDINHTAILGDTITDFTIEKPSKLSDPAMIFINMDIFLEVILSKKDLMRAGLDKQVEVRKMAQMFNGWHQFSLFRMIKPNNFSKRSVPLFSMASLLRSKKNMVLNR